MVMSCLPSLTSLCRNTVVDDEGVRDGGRLGACLSSQMERKLLGHSAIYFS